MKTLSVALASLCLCFSLSASAQSYKASALNIKDIVGDVSINVSNTSSVEVRIDGDAKQIQQHLDHGTLTIEEPTSPTNLENITIPGLISNGSVVIVSGTSTAVINGKVYRNGKETPPVHLTITVPKRTPIIVDDVMGTVTVGDTEGALDAHILGDTKLNVGKVSDLKIEINGAGSAVIKKVTAQSMAVSITGSGDATILSGNVDRLKAAITGSGDVKFQGVATTADLNVTGSGDIFVKESKNQPTQSVTGSGDIVVGNWK